MEKVKNFKKFAQFPWASQGLEMALKTGHLCTLYMPSEFGRLIAVGAFADALQKTTSVGLWRDSVQGREYWERIYDGESWD